uniref:Permease n=1 Tax=Solibacter usitatus (strain Ellin6076) TaxID=234267 RepID=Q01ZC6_SOLUE
MSEFFRRLRYLLNRRRFDRELAGDLEFHREMAARENRPFSNTLHLREEAREAWGWTWIDRLSQDLCYAFRLLRKSPGFTLAAVLILSIGIGVNIAAFGFFNLMVLRPLPVRDPATLVRFQRLSPKGYASVLPYPEMAFFREHATTLSTVLAWTPSTLRMEHEQGPLKAQFVTANFFSELGATAGLGRLFDSSDDKTNGGGPVVVLSYAFWQSHFGADASIVGKTIRLNDRPVTVLGIASSEFSGLSLEGPELWLPITQHPYLVNGSKLLTDYSVEGSGVTVWGRLRPGLTPKAAGEELRSLAAALRLGHPNDIWENESLPGSPGAYATSAFNQSHHGTGTKDSNKMVPVAALAAALVLLILAVACGNLGSLVLARGVARAREITIRAAIGAGTSRLVRQLFTESLLLGALGSVGGLGLGYVVLRGLMAVSGTPAWMDPAPDWRVMLFAIALGFLAAILFGLTPAFQVVRQRHQATLVRQILIGAQVAASCVLLIVAGLLVQTLNHASGDPGFAYRQVVSIDPSLGNNGYPPAKAWAYINTLESRLRALPGVESVSSASTPPLGKKTVTIGLEIGGRPISIHPNSIEPGYFQTVNIPLLRGRDLMRGVTDGIVVSQSLALAAWPGKDPLNQQLDLDGRKYTVVGVSGNARVAQLEDRESTEAYFLAGAADMPSMVVLVKASRRPEEVASAVASIAKAVDSGIIPEVQLMRTSFDNRLRGAQYSALSVSVLALVALFLACLGIVGLVAYAVSQRTKEIAIRMALGARPSHVFAIVMGQFTRPVVVGLLVGLGGAVALSRILRQVLFGVGSFDPVAYLGAIGLFTATVALASLFPARRALLVDPIRALRND